MVLFLLLRVDLGLVEAVEIVEVSQEPAEGPRWVEISKLELYLGSTPQVGFARTSDLSVQENMAAMAVDQVNSLSSL